MAETPKVARVFVVDDEPVIATTLATILRMNGFEARSFENPLEALDAARMGSPALLISDVMMPQMTGVELAIRMRGEHPTCKVLLFSGQAATADLLEDARGRGHQFEIMTKPIHPRDFLIKIKGVTEQIVA